MATTPGVAGPRASFREGPVQFSPMTWGRTDSHAKCIAWAQELPADAEVSTAEVLARLVLEDGRLRRAVERGTARSRKPAPRSTEVVAGAADHDRPAPWPKRVRAGWRELKLAAVVAGIALPLLGVVLFPDWRTPHSARRMHSESLMSVVADAFAATAVLHLVMLTVWAVRPGAFSGSILRYLHIQITVVAAVIFAPVLGVLFLASGGESGGWALLAILLAVLLAILGFLAEASERTSRHSEDNSVRRIARMLQEDPDPSGESGTVRGPVRELRRVLRRFPDDDREALMRCRDDVIDVLVARGLVDATLVRRLKGLPFEQMHEAADAAGG